MSVWLNLQRCWRVHPSLLSGLFVSQQLQKINPTNNTPSKYTPKPHTPPKNPHTTNHQKTPNQAANQNVNQTKPHADFKRPFPCWAILKAHLTPSSHDLESATGYKLKFIPSVRKTQCLGCEPRATEGLGEAALPSANRTHTSYTWDWTNGTKRSTMTHWQHQCLYSITLCGTGGKPRIHVAGQVRSLETASCSALLCVTHGQQDQRQPQLGKQSNQHWGEEIGDLCSCLQQNIFFCLGYREFSACFI